MSIKKAIERLALWWDGLVLQANREPDAAAHPPGCACIRCDATVPEEPCAHPASTRYELRATGIPAMDRACSGVWYCGECGDPCDPPAVLPDPRPPVPTWRSMKAPVEPPLGWSNDPTCVCDEIDASIRPCIACVARASVIGRIED